MKNVISYHSFKADARGYGNTMTALSLNAAIEAKPITSAVLWDHCQQAQRKRLISLAQKQAAATLEEINVTALNATFPLDACLVRSAK